MKEDQNQFLRLLGRLPARLTAEQAAWVLNCQPHDIPALISARLLKPLANPAPNAIKFFATADLLENMKDRNWLARVTATINQHWQAKNARKKELATETQEAGEAQGIIPTLSISPEEKGAERPPTAPRQRLLVRKVVPRCERRMAWNAGRWWREIKCVTNNTDF